MLRSYSLDRSLTTINPAGYTPDNLYPNGFVGIALLSVLFRIEYLYLFIAMDAIPPHSYRLVSVSFIPLLTITIDYFIGLSPL